MDDFLDFILSDYSESRLNVQIGEQLDIDDIKDRKYFSVESKISDDERYGTYETEEQKDFNAGLENSDDEQTDINNLNEKQKNVHGEMLKVIENMIYSFSSKNKGTQNEYDQETSYYSFCSNKVEKSTIHETDSTCNSNSTIDRFPEHFNVIQDYRPRNFLSKKFKETSLEELNDTFIQAKIFRIDYSNSNTSRSDEDDYNISIKRNPGLLESDFKKNIYRNLSRKTQTFAKKEGYDKILKYLIYELQKRDGDSSNSDHRREARLIATEFKSWIGYQRKNIDSKKKLGEFLRIREETQADQIIYKKLFQLLMLYFIKTQYDIWLDNSRQLSDVGRDALKAYRLTLKEFIYNIDS